MPEENNKAAAIPDTVSSNQVAPVLVAPRWSWKAWLIWCVLSYVIIVAEAYSGILPGKKDPVFLLLGLVSTPIVATCYYGTYFLIKRVVYWGRLAGLLMNHSKQLNDTMQPTTHRVLAPLSR